MNEQDFFANLPTGKDDPPLLFPLGPMEYSRTDIDGLYYMLDRDLSGCLLMAFAKPMEPTVRGTAAIDGEPLPPCILKQMAVMGGLWVLGLPLRGHVSEYGKDYALHVEGFRDTDGNDMAPQDFTVHCSDRATPDPKYAEHEAVALRAASEGIVLMKNQHDVLPLAKGSILNLFGKGINQFRTSAVGAGKINPRYTVDLAEAAREHSPFRLNEELARFYRCDRDAVPDEAMLRAARDASNTAVMVITRGTGENLDNSTARGEWYLSEDEETLLTVLRERFEYLVVILNTGYPMDVAWAEKYQVDALLYNGFGGMLAGQAVVDVLAGMTNPSGHLPDTWAKDYSDIPASRNFYDCVDKPRYDADSGVYIDTVYEEGLYVGYRYFSTFGKEPAYPFGFGLSFTTFEVTCSQPFFADGLTAEITVTNTGKVPGKQAPQLYVRKPPALCETPERELAWFGKTRELAPGERQIMTARVELREMAVFDVDRAAWVVPAGEYILFTGTDATAPETGRFTVEREIVLRQSEHLMLPPEPPTELIQGDPAGTFPSGTRSGIKTEKGFAPAAQRRHYVPEFSGSAPEGRLTYADVKADPTLTDSFVAQMTVEEMARLTVCASAGWGMEGIGEAGRVFHVEGYDLPDFPVADGNSGVNLRIPNIGMPSGVTMAAAFDPELMEDIGRVIGEEARELGMPMILAPGMNLHRDPLNGRQPEYFSEDPYLAGILAGHYCKGMESTGTASCIKHLCANNCESARKSNQSIIGERALRELYLKPFAVAMSIQMPAGVMTAYNACNGRPTSADEELLIGWLRKEQGFDGFVMTDWGTYDTVDVVEMVQAGMSWITPGSLDETYTRPIVDGVAEGRIDQDRLRENTARMVRTLVRYV